MNFLLIAGLLLSGSLFASTELQLSSQHISITRGNETGWQFDLTGKHDLSRKLYAGLTGSYLERFSFYENRFGGLLGYRLTDRLTLEGQFILGETNNQILPREQRVLSAYYALAKGFTPYLTYRDYRYSITRVHMANLGMEIEKIPNVILIPQVMVGTATFSRPAGTETVQNYGLRAVYYVEKKFNAYIFGYRGKEASQGIVGASNFLVDTRTGGLGGSWFFTENFRVEAVFDHTDYEQLKNQFLTTTLNFFWTVDE